MEFEVIYNDIDGSFTLKPLTGFEPDFYIMLDRNGRFECCESYKLIDDSEVMLGGEPVCKRIELKPKRWMKRIYLSKSLRRYADYQYFEAQQAAYYGCGSLFKLEPAVISINNK